MTGGDITRATFDPPRHFSSVRMQQGRVQLDADWNEQVDIAAHRERAEIVDVVGASGAPKGSAGFGLTPTPDGTDLTLGPGRLYVGGVLCELESTEVTASDLATDGVTVAEVVLDGRELAEHDWVEVAGASGSVLTRLSHVDVPARRLTFADTVDTSSLTGALTLRRVPSYATQPDLPAPDLTTRADATAPRVLALPDGGYLAYVDVWERTETALEEPAIRELALDGPDTTTRTRVVAQVRLLLLATTPDPQQPDADIPEWTALTTPSGGLMAAFAQADDPETTPCVLPASGGFQGLENQLYRVQIWDPARFVWSRENASVATRWAVGDGDQITLDYAAQDRVLGFAAGDWVELTDDTHELAALPGTLVQVLKSETDRLTVDLTSATGPVDIAGFPVNPKVRRWDSPGILPLTRDVAIELEAGLQVLFPSGGGYRPGDHWLIPARTGVSDVLWPRDSSGHPLAVPPHGITHRYARLALVVAEAGTTAVTDWRPRFPALAELTADDVTFDDSVCALTDAETVQDALERLCQERDLRYHNRNLHGWGIVNGLQVHCGPNTEGEPRRFVTVHPGYAIDIEGMDVNVDADVPIDVIDRIEALQDGGVAVLDNGDGEVALILDPASRPDQVRVEKFDATTEDRSLLAGTILNDFYRDCIKPIREFVHDELSSEGDPTPVGPARQRLTALTNLVTQPVNPAAGQNIFIAEREDKLIRDFYTGLRQLLTSETYCAMFDNARQVPPYPFPGLGIDTIFGTGSHSRLRLHPSGQEAWTLGAGVNPTKPVTRINRYDLKARQLVAVIDPVAGEVLTGAQPDSGAGAVQDVAFSPDGKLIYVAIATRDENNTIFRVGGLGAAGVTWRPMTTICGVKLVTLVTTLADPAHVYAIGLHKVTKPDGGKGGGQRLEWQGAGLFRIDPAAVDPNLQPLPIQNFNPVGHLVVDDQGAAVATAAPVDQPVTSYSMLVHVKLPEATESGDRISLPNTGADDIALASRKGQTSPPDSVWTVVDLVGTKAVVGHELASGDLLTPTPIALDNSTTRLRAVGRTLLATSSDKYCLRAIDVTAGALVDGYLLPLQVGPISIAADAKNRVYVLNQVSNSLTVVPPPLLDPAFRFDLAALIDYRKAMLEAFADLLGGFLQYLKDCFCDLLLVDPPTSTGQEKLFLGCISIRQNAVHKICNLSRRRYVGSFPTLSYWLSTIPVVPLVTHLVERLCCLALPEVFAKVTVSGSAEQEDVGGDRLSVAALHQLIALGQGGGFSDRIREFASRGTIARTATMAALRQLQQVQPPPSVAPFSATSIVGQPADQAAASLAKRGVGVRRAPFEPKADLHTITSAVDILRDPQPGRQVTLYEEEGRVRYYTVSATDPTMRVRTEVDSLRSTVQRQSDEVTGLRQQLAETTGQLGDRDAQLARISQELSEMRQAHADLQASVPQQLADIQRDIAQLRAEPAAPAATRQPRKRSSGRTEPPPTS